MKWLFPFLGLEIVLKHPNVSDFRSPHCPLPGYTLDRRLLDPCTIPGNIMHHGGQDGAVLEPGHRNRFQKNGSPDQVKSVVEAGASSVQGKKGFEYV